MNHRASRTVAEEKLEAVARALHVPEEERSSTVGIAASELHQVSFKGSDMGIQLCNWLCLNVSWKK